MKINELLENSPFEDVLLLRNFSYDQALIGLSNDGRAIYDFDKMVKWLVARESCSEEQAIEWIQNNTLKSLEYFGEKAPIVMYPCEVEDEASST